MFAERAIIRGIIRKPKVKNYIRYEYDLDHIDCEKNEVTFHRYINHSDGSKRKVQYVVGIEEIVQIIPLNKTQRGECCELLWPLNKTQRGECCELLWRFF
ncbi:hypothetical protein L1D58_22715, partial [Vibrio diabolicus]|nr:hypothetical protein [Vibrio diabolicus]